MNPKQQFIFLGLYGKTLKFRNLATMKQVEAKYVGQSHPQVGTICTLIFGSTVRVLWEQTATAADHARTIELAMSSWGQNRTRRAYGKAFTRGCTRGYYASQAKKGYRHSLKYGYAFFC